MAVDLVSIWNIYEENAMKTLFWPDTQYDYGWIGLYSNMVTISK